LEEALDLSYERLLMVMTNKTGSVLWSGNMDDDEETRASFVTF
jgi:hypothetical protein